MHVFLLDARRFILKFAQIVDTAPLQLYNSGLIFAPYKALIKENFKGELPAWLFRGPKVEEYWSPEIQTLEGHSGSVLSVAFSGDGQLLASASEDHTIKLWDPATGALKQTLKGHFTWVLSVAFSGDGQLLASASYDRTIKLWDPATSALKHTISTDDVVTNIQFSKHLPQLITNLGSFDITICYESFSSNTSEKVTEALLQAGRWVTVQGQRELWLPPNYNPSSSAVKDGTIGLGCVSGRVAMITFSTM